METVNFEDCNTSYLIFFLAKETFRCRTLINTVKYTLLYSTNMDAFRKVFLVLLLFISRNVAFNFDGDLNTLKNTVQVLSEEMNSLKEAALVLSKRMDCLQQILGNVSHSNGITSYNPQSTDEILNPTEAVKEENGVLV